MIRQFLLPVLLICATLLSSCAEDTVETNAANPSRPTLGSSRLEDILYGSAAPAQSEIANAADILICEDEEGLVQVRIVNGAAELSFDLERWEALHGLKPEEHEGVLHKGPFDIISAHGAIKDACIVQVPEMDTRHRHEEFVTPTVMLLMEDGSLEYLLADPLEDRMDDCYYSYGPLPWLKQIESLSYQSASEGLSPTIFATDSSGFRYNAIRAARYCFIFYGDWNMPLDPEVGGRSGYIAVLRFLNETQAEFLVKSKYEVTEYYVGEYELLLREDGHAATTYDAIDFTLSLEGLKREGGNDTTYPRNWISNVCFAELIDDSALQLRTRYGDHFYDNQYHDAAEPLTEYLFTYSPHAGSGWEQPLHPATESILRDSMANHLMAVLTDPTLPEYQELTPTAETLDSPLLQADDPDTSLLVSLKNDLHVIIEIVEYAPDQKSLNSKEVLFDFYANEGDHFALPSMLNEDAPLLRITASCGLLNEQWLHRANDSDEPIRFIEGGYG